MRYIILGIFVGSLIDCIAYRQIHHLNYISDHSRCEHCGKKIAWYDLIPIISFILLKGRCRFCGKKIRKGVLCSEIIGGLIGYLCHGDINFFVILNTLYLLTLVDYATMEVYNVDLIPLILVDIIRYIHNYVKYTCDYSVFLVTIFMFILIIIGLKGLMGMGDVFIILLLGFYTEKSIFIILLYASLSGIIYYLMKEKYHKGSIEQPIPFVPMLFIGTILTILTNSFLFSI